MDVDTLVIGGGVVGLACAAELATRYRVLLLERHGEAGRETSSRNSEVIHAGLYYPAGSLKAELCVAGRELLYERCTRLSLPHRQIGKLVVATSDLELATLEQIEQRAQTNGAELGGWLDPAQLRRLEPRVRAIAALWSPKTGIVDAHSLMSSYQAELAAKGGECVFHTEVLGLEAISGGAWRVATRLRGQSESFPLDARTVINAAGLGAPRVAELAGIDVAAHGLRQFPCKGDYFALAPRLGAITRHLVYPVPVAGGLGVHITVDLGGRFRLGPDVEYVDDAAELAVDPAKAKDFAEAARRYLPEIESRDLSPDFAGIRPKLQSPGGPFRDFCIQETSAIGAPGLIHLGGIESPGLTSAPAIARRVKRIIDDLLQ